MPWVLLAAFSTAAAAAQEGEVHLKPQRFLIPTPQASKEPVPLFVEADKLQGHQDQELEGEGKVRLRRRGKVVWADWLRYDKPEDEVNAEGNVRIEQYDDVVEGSKLKLNLETDRGFMNDANFWLNTERRSRIPAEQRAYLATAAPRRQIYVPTPITTRGTANRIFFEGEGRYRGETASLTTCEPDKEAWFIHAADLEIDEDRNIGTARNAKLEFMGHTIFYSPYLNFPLEEGRKTGFLVPNFGTTGRTGPQVTLPFYWNIAPNYDATIAPGYLQKQGERLQTEFRYLNPTYAGEFRYDVLPSDRARNDELRYALSLKHQQRWDGGWYGALNVQQASDGNFFTDLSTTVAQTSQSILPREGVLGKNGSWLNGGPWGANVLFQRWQTLQPDPSNPITPPYNRSPQLTLNAATRDVGGVDFDFVGNYNDFRHPTLVTGKRVMVQPSFSLPLQTSFAYITPKIGLNYRSYSLNASTTTLPNQTITTPILSVDSGLVFERDTNLLGQAYTHTFEPKLYYVKIPFRDQSQLPNFESGLQDINFATIFSDNQFAGYDRINDASALTWGIASRLIQPENGIERLRGVVAQRYYFEPQRVTLPGVPARTSNTSDLLATLGGTVVRNWSAEFGWQYTSQLSQTQRFTAGTRYNPAPGQLLNLAYRFNRAQNVEQIDVSGQWPLFSGWRAVGRWNYSLKNNPASPNNNRLLEGVAGIEYNGGCWVLRAVAQQFAITGSNSVSMFFVQLELFGFASVGTDPGDILRRSVPGYASQFPRTSIPEDPLLMR